MGCLEGIGKRCLLGLHRVFERFRIDAKENIARLQLGVRFNGNLGHHAADGGNDRRGVEVEPGLTAERVVVVHAQHQCGKDRDAPERSREQREAVDRNLEYTKHAVSECGIGENDQ
jgi:hypothetical protein